MDTTRIAALLEPFLEQPLPASALEQISIYIDLLLRWNARVNLTAIRDPEQIVTRHFGESIFLARHLFPNRLARTLFSAQGGRPSPPHERAQPGADAQSNPPRVLDLGSGAGFPGLPIKIWSPAVHLILIESNHRKAAFLREVARSLTLTDVNVISERAETLVGNNKPQADVVTLRAVERFEAILPTAIGFLAPRARLALLLGASQLPHLSTLTPTVDWAESINVPQSQSRVLAIVVHEP